VSRALSLVVVVVEVGCYGVEVVLVAFGCVKVEVVVVIVIVRCYDSSGGGGSGG